MANILKREKQVRAVSALCEGSSIRSIERMTGIHRDTIMRLGIRVGTGCAVLLDDLMQNLSCNYLQLDEIWGFIRKKKKNAKPGELDAGDAWTFIAIDAESRHVLSRQVLYCLFSQPTTPFYLAEDS